VSWKWTVTLKPSVLDLKVLLMGAVRVNGSASGTTKDRFEPHTPAATAGFEPNEMSDMSAKPAKASAMTRRSAFEPMEIECPLNALTPQSSENSATLARRNLTCK
jgi:hypothetical protein